MLDLAKYFIAIPGYSDTLTEDWKWLLGDRRFSTHRITCFGDIFLLNASGGVFFLDMMEGKISSFASSEQEFDNKLKDRHTRQRYLATFLVRDLMDAGVILQFGQCYSPDRPPILGGDLSQDNLRPIDVYVHASVMGQIHRQVKDLPPGTPISSIVVE